MTHHDLIALLGTTAATWPFRAGARQLERTRCIAGSYTLFPMTFELMTNPKTHEALMCVTPPPRLRSPAACPWWIGLEAIRSIAQLPSRCFMVPLAATCGDTAPTKH